MKLKSILAEGTRHNRLALVCDTEMTKDFANRINDLADLRSGMERGELSFMAEGGNLIVTGMDYPPPKTLFQDIKSLLDEVATKIDLENKSRKDSHQKIVETVSEISGLPIS